MLSRTRSRPFLFSDFEGGRFDQFLPTGSQATEGQVRGFQGPLDRLGAGRDFALRGPGFLFGGDSQRFFGLGDLTFRPESSPWVFPKNPFFLYKHPGYTGPPF